MELSKKRAFAVADWLMAHTTLSPQQFEVLWMGESCPAVPNTDEAARRKNRRVVIRNTGEKPRITMKALPLHVEVRHHGPTDIVVLSDGDTIPTGGRYSISFKTATKPYVYVCQQDSSGKLDVLFPNPDLSSLTNPLEPGKSYTIPDSAAAFVLDATQGAEVIAALAVDHGPARCPRWPAAISSRPEGKTGNSAATRGTRRHHFSGPLPR